VPIGRKRLSYTCSGSRSLESAADHWEGFSFTGGGWRVIYSGPWGMLQVWASSEAEGRRVILHACSHAGIDPTDPRGIWSVRNVGGRFGRVRRFRVGTWKGAPTVTARDGPDGLPSLAAPD